MVLPDHTTILPMAIKLKWPFSSKSNVIQKHPPEVFYKKGILYNFAKFTGKQLCQILFFNEDRTSFLTEHLRVTASEYFFVKP